MIFCLGSFFKKFEKNNKEEKKVRKKINENRKIEKGKRKGNDRIKIN